MTKTTRVLLGVTSGLLLTFAAAMFVAFIALAWLPGTHRNGDGFVTSDAVTLATDGYAITSTDIDIRSVPDEWLPSNIIGTFRLEAESSDGSRLFLGVAPSAEVDDFLADVSHRVVDRLGPWQPVEVIEHQGNAAADIPGSADFWRASTQGKGFLSLDWEPEWGEWTLVVMNADGSSGVDVSTSIGVNTPWLPAGLVITGMLALISGAVGLVLAALALRRPASAPPEEAARRQPATIGG